MKPLLIFLVLSLSCSSMTNSDDKKEQDPFDHAELQAAVTSVSAQGSSGAYTFSVGISSPDEGCERYADWWEVITPDSVLIYRRILAHSHVDEQPFTRSGGPINIGDNDPVLIRAHMNDLGYGSRVFSGTVSNGFSEDSLRINFGASLSSQAPLPSGCAF